MKHLEPKEAHQFLKKNLNAVFVDCKSEIRNHHRNAVTGWRFGGLPWEQT